MEQPGSPTHVPEERDESARHIEEDALLDSGVVSSQPFERLGGEHVADDRRFCINVRSAGLPGQLGPLASPASPRALRSRAEPLDWIDHATC